MSHLPSTVRRINLLGGLRAEAARISGEKTIGLLAYLALRPQALHPREALIELLWPDLAPDQSRRRLSDALYRLRKSLGPDCLITDDKRVGLNAAAVWIDADEFSTLSEASEPGPLRRAIGLYAGDLLPELYDDWILPHRVRLREKYLTALFELGHLLEQSQDFATALETYRRLIAGDPLHEDAHCAVMRCLARLNRHTAALQQYDQLAQTLQAELKIDPLPETRALADSIRAELALLQVTASRAAFVGRTTERAQALEAVEALIANRGGALAIEGPPGIGKSRLWEEIAAGAQWRGITVVSGRAAEHSAESPFAPLSEALAQALHGPRAAQIEVLLPDETLAAVGELYPPWRDRSTPIDLPPDQARRRFQRAVIKVWQALASLAPHVILLDDMQWATAALWETLDALLAEIRVSSSLADDPSLRGTLSATKQSPAFEAETASHSSTPLHSAQNARNDAALGDQPGQRSSSQRLLIGLAYRRPEIEHTAGWSTLQSWERDGRLQMIELKPLTLNEVMELLPPAHRSRAETIAALSGGNPFYVTQMQIALDEGYALDRQPVLVRAAALLATARAALAAAAILGDKISFRSWSAICELPPIELAAAAEQLVVHGFLQINEGGYRFAHDLIQAIIYEQIDPDQCRRLHRRTAQVIREFDPDNVHTLAYHLDRAGEAEEAAAAYRRAGEQDRSRFAFAEAQASFERALELLPDEATPAHIETWLALAQVCDVVGARERQRGAIAAARREALVIEEVPLLMRVLLLAGRFAAQTGDLQVAEDTYMEVLRLAQRSGDTTQQIEAAFLLGDLANRKGDHEEARRRYQQVLTQAESLGDRSRMARALRGLGLITRRNGQPAEAIRWFERALTLQQAVGDRIGESITLVNLLSSFYDLGAWDRLLGLAEETRTLSESLGRQESIALVQHLQGLAFFALGDFEAARRCLADALRLYEEIGDRVTAGLTHNAIGLVAEAEDDLPRAQHAYEVALTAAVDLNATTEAAYAQHDLGALLLRLNHHHAAIPLLEAARAKWRELGNDLLRLKSEACLGLALLANDDQSTARELAEENWLAFQRGGLSGEQPQSWLWALQQLLSQLDQPERATSVLRAAYAELQRQGEAVADDRLRQQFFNRVPLNRSIVEAYDRLNQRQRRLIVILARAAVPLGRKLSDRDVVTIEWTIAAPEDDAIADPIERRRYILSRLIAEARSAGAAPTDDDLARALDVSRRTILRDIEALAQAGVKLPTRRRKS